VLDEEFAKCGDDRDAAPAGAALRLAGFSVAVHAALDADQPVGEVDVVPEECAKLAAPQAGVERAAPERVVLHAKGGDQRGSLLGEAMRSRRPRTAGSRSRSHGLIARSPSSSRFERSGAHG
jgi:hypothetical protein